MTWTSCCRPLGASREDNEADDGAGDDELRRRSSRRRKHLPLTRVHSPPVALIHDACPTNFNALPTISHSVAHPPPDKHRAESRLVRQGVAPGKDRITIGVSRK